MTITSNFTHALVKSGDSYFTKFVFDILVHFSCESDEKLIRPVYDRHT